jgi:catechol 2,3-dioxygenase-like lactoylglutathione lyase family enzyme
MSSDATTTATAQDIGLGALTSTVVQCTDLEQALPFYTEKLGLERQTGGEGWALLDGGSGSLVLVRASEREVVMAFTGGDLQASRAALAARGAEPTEIEAHPGGEHYFVVDPEGNRVMIGT